MPTLAKCTTSIAIMAAVSCGQPTAPGGAPTPASPVTNTSVTVDLSGRTVDADAGGPVGGVRVWLETLSGSGKLVLWVSPTHYVTSGADGTFTLTLNLPASWPRLTLRLTGPPGYDDTNQRFDRTTATDRPSIRMYPTLAIRPGESIEVRVHEGIVWCGWDGVPCRRVMITASPGDPVEIEMISFDSSKPMGLGITDSADPDTSLRRVMVPPGGFAYVIGVGTARLSARR